MERQTQPRQFEKLFEGKKKSHGYLKGMLWDKIDEDGKCTKDARTRHKAPNFNNHLNGIEKIGIIPFVSSDRCKWGAVDVDEYSNLDHKKLVNKLRDKNIPGVVTRSTNGGAHIWFFFDKAVPSHLLVNKLRGVRNELGMNPNGEVFPKQTALGPGDTGNYLFLPYFPKKIDTENKQFVDGCDTYCITEEGKELSLEEFEDYATAYVSNKLNDMKVDGWIDNGEEYTQSESIDPEDVEEGLEDAPSCVQFCGSQITKEGKGRDAFMYAYTLYKLKKNKVVSINDMKWLNKKNDPPLSDKDLSRIHKQVHKNKKQQYNCNAVKPYYCNKETCRLQKYGIGSKSNDSYFDNWLYVKYPPQVVKLKPEPKVYKTNEAREVMLVERGMIQVSAKSTIHPGHLYLDKIARHNAVDYLEWHPAKPDIFHSKVRNGTVKVFNNFVPTSVIPIEGDTAQWEDFLDTRFKHPEYRKWFEDFWAHKIQKPEVRIMSNILLISDWGGTGKSLIGETMEELFGRHNTANISLDAMESGWSDIVMNKLLISVEEIYDTGQHRAKIASIIKRLTTIKTEFGNMKYGKFQQAEVYGSLYFQSNSKSAITVKKQDRRPGIYKLDNDREDLMDQNNREGDLLKEWLDEDDGYGKLLHRLLTRDVSDFSPTAWPPQTDAKNMMVANTAGFKYAKIMTAWNDRMFPFTTQSKVYCPRWIAHLLKCDPEEVEALFVEQLGCQKLGRVQNVDFVIYDRNNNNKPFQVDSTRTEVILYTNDPDLIANKEAMKPKQWMEYYLHPIQHGGKNYYGQDDRVNENLLEKLNTDNTG